MCFTRQVKRKQKNKVEPFIPDPVAPPSFTVEEAIECFGCKEVYPLLEETQKQGIKIHCAGCDQFFHCKVAGTCYGPHCSHQTGIGSVHRSAWCVGCVPKYAINREKESREDRCVCKDCFKCL